MIRVLVDGRVNGHDGIGRYTNCLVTALRKHASHAVRVEVLTSATASRYSRAEGEELLHAAESRGADVLHLLDYRVPLESARFPLVVTIHDVLRLVRPQHCYSDDDFVARFGPEGLGELRSATMVLRELAGYPSGAARSPRSVHEEFYARMLALAGARAARMVTPTWSVARQLSESIGRDGGVRVSPWGVDHLQFDRPNDYPAGGVRLPQGGRYLLYVGQARSHKGLPALLDAFTASRAPRLGVRLLCVGRDFAVGAYGAQLLAEKAGEAGVAVGAVTDRTLAWLYQHSEALVHLAEHEGFGFPPLEAAAAGCRVIVGDIPVLRETLGDHATYVDIQHLDCVADAIDRLLVTPDDPVRRESRMRWTCRYRWRRHTRDVLAVYAEAAHER